MPGLARWPRRVGISDLPCMLDAAHPMRDLMSQTCQLRRVRRTCSMHVWFAPRLLNDLRKRAVKPQLVEVHIEVGVERAAVGQDQRHCSELRVEAVIAHLSRPPACSYAMHGARSGTKVTGLATCPDSSVHCHFYRHQNQMGGSYCHRAGATTNHRSDCKTVQKAHYKADRKKYQL